MHRRKLNLNDLAGIERVAKGDVDSATLSRATFVNVISHFLEQVIMALKLLSLGSFDCMGWGCQEWCMSALAPL